MAALELEDEYREIVESANDDSQRVEAAPTAAQQLGPFTVMCLILNRTIGSGIFSTPSLVLEATGSVGASLLLWAVGGLIAICGLLVWLELGLSVPLSKVPGEEGEKSVPRSGGEKNFLEFVFPKPAFLTTCMFGTVFVLLGNLSGNGIAFGQYCFEAAGYSAADTPRGPVIGLALAALSACVLLHMFSRRGGILLNNCFAVCKVLLLLVIAALGLAKAGGAPLGGSPAATANFDPATAFAGRPRAAASYADALIYVLYCYSGFEQPFYVLSEVRRPRRTFPAATLAALGTAAVLFVLVNVAYLCAVPAALQLAHPADRMATIFLGRVFGDAAAQQAMAGLIAVSIFGNILVMTFTAARVKQEIAKEGVLPFSLFFATSHTSPWAWLRSTRAAAPSLSAHLEQTPIPALALHWLSSVLLIAVTSMLAPAVSYAVLINLYTYVVVAGFGCVVAAALLYLYARPSRNWRTHCNFRVPLRPLHAVIYFLATAFMLGAAFARPPEASSADGTGTPYPWFLVPAIGQSAWLWGIAWWAALLLFLRLRRETLVVTRVPVIAADGAGDWTQKYEVVTHERHVDVRAPVPAGVPVSAVRVEEGRDAYGHGYGYGHGIGSASF